LKRVVRAHVHADAVAHAEPLDRHQRVGHALLEPLVARDHADAHDLDLALRLQLRGHDAELAVVAHGVVVAVDDDLLRGRRRSAEARAQPMPPPFAPAATTRQHRDDDDEHRPDPFAHLLLLKKCLVGASAGLVTAMRYKRLRKALRKRLPNSTARAAGVASAMA
jgi:hypothetical protein